MRIHSESCSCEAPSSAIAHAQASMEVVLEGEVTRGNLSRPTRSVGVESEADANQLAEQRDASGEQAGPAENDPKVNVEVNTDARGLEEKPRPTEDRSGKDKDKEDPWSLCTEEVWKYEENQINKWKENINNLLLFAGLFSTILAGFIVAFYLLLGPTTPDTTTQVLIIVSIQLSILTAAIAHSNLTQSQQSVLQPEAASATIRLMTSTVSTGVLWFVALIFSLSAASISIAVGQWLHHHTDRASSMSRQSVRIWAYHCRSLEKWHVRVIIDLLPILLQISLALFLIGLLELLWALNHVIAAIVTALIIILLLPTLITVFLPYLFADCPYKSRAAWLCFVILRRVARFGQSLQAKRPCATTLIVRIAGLPWELSDRGRTAFQNWKTSPSAVRLHIARLPRTFLDHSRAAYQGWKTWDPEALRYRKKWQSDTHTARNWREFENLPARAEVLEEKDKLILLAEADELIMDDAFLSNHIASVFNGSGRGLLVRKCVPTIKTSNTKLTIVICDFKDINSVLLCLCSIFRTIFKRLDLVGRALSRHRLPCGPGPSRPTGLGSARSEGSEPGFAHHYEEDVFDDDWHRIPWGSGIGSCVSLSVPHTVMRNTRPSAIEGMPHKAP
ncbi:predicted protein [Postia placenta Mad-698-R]|nr:predicted protein [Postia placenta Mad-698-R]